MSVPNGKETPEKNDHVALQASSASITTASVTIRTLRVNDHQLTQSIFKQLPKRVLIDTRTVDLLGDVWGWVNYDPDRSPTNRQFVVQFGAILCRCPFFVRDLNRSNTTEWPGELEAYFVRYVSFAENYVLACGLKGRLDFSHRKEDRSYFLPERPFFGTYEVEFGKGKNLEESVEYGLRHRFHPETERQVYQRGGTHLIEPVPQAEIDERTRRYTEQLYAVFQSRTSDWEKPPAWWSAELDGIAAAADSYVKGWNALMARLRTYEQLYIAA